MSFLDEFLGRTNRAYTGNTGSPGNPSPKDQKDLLSSLMGGVVRGLGGGEETAEEMESYSRTVQGNVSGGLDSLFGGLQQIDTLGGRKEMPDDVAMGMLPSGKTTMGVLGGIGLATAAPSMLNLDRLFPGEEPEAPDAGQLADLPPKDRREMTPEELAQEAPIPEQSEDTLPLTELDVLPPMESAPTGVQDVAVSTPQQELMGQQDAKNEEVMQQLFAGLPQPQDFIPSQAPGQQAPADDALDMQLKQRIDTLLGGGQGDPTAQGVDPQQQTFMSGRDQAIARLEAAQDKLGQAGRPNINVGPPPQQGMFGGTMGTILSGLLPILLGMLLKKPKAGAMGALAGINAAMKQQDKYSKDLDRYHSRVAAAESKAAALERQGLMSEIALDKDIAGLLAKAPPGGPEAADPLMQAVSLDKILRDRQEDTQEVAGESLEDVLKNLNTQEDILKKRSERLGLEGGVDEEQQLNLEKKRLDIIKLRQGIDEKAASKQMTPEEFLASGDAAVKDLTEGQRKTLLFGPTAQEASKRMALLEEKLDPRSWDYMRQNLDMASLFPIIDGKVQMKVPTALQDKNVQRYLNAASQFMNAFLRTESGAAINTSEKAEEFFRSAIGVGDFDETVAQKQEFRQIRLDAMLAGLGDAPLELYEARRTRSTENLDERVKQYNGRIRGTKALIRAPRNVKLSNGSTYRKGEWMQVNTKSLPRLLKELGD